MDLIKACKEGKLEKVKELLEIEYVNINFQNEEGDTALHIAIEKGNEDICKYLISYSQDEEGIIYISELYSDEKDPDPTDKMNLNIQNKKGRTPLFLACLKGMYEIVLLLIRNGADKDIADECRIKPIHLSVFNNYIDITSFLLYLGTDIETKDQYGHTLLQAAVDEGRLETCELLINRGADINVIDEEGNSLLHLASRADYDDLVKLFLNRGLNPDYKNIFDQTVLHIAKDWRSKSFLPNRKLETEEILSCYPFV